MKRSILKSFLKILRNNLSLKIAAVLFALILWSYVIAETNPIRPVTVENVPVTIVNLDGLKAKSLTVSEDLTKAIKDVRVNLEVRQKEIKLVNNETVTARIDFSKVNAKGKVQLKVLVSTKYGTFINAQPSNITLTIDDYITKPIPVKCTVTGGRSNGYYIGAPQLSPDVIEIMGARADVSKAASALCTANLTGKTASFNQSLDVTVLDDEGKPLNTEAYFEKLPSVIVKIDILPKKEVTVNGFGSVVNAGKVKDGYEITGISIQPEKIEIAGEKALIDTVSEVFLEQMDVAGASEDMTFNVAPKAIEGVRFIDVNEITAIVHISQKQAQRVFKDVPVAVQNLPMGLSAVLFQKTVDVKVTGGIEDIKALNKSDIKPYVDLKEYSKGIYTLTLQAQSLENVASENISYTPTEIMVTIK